MLDIPILTDLIFGVLQHYNVVSSFNYKNGVTLLGGAEPVSIGSIGTKLLG